MAGGGGGMIDFNQVLESLFPSHMSDDHDPGIYQGHIWQNGLCRRFGFS